METLEEKIGDVKVLHLRGRLDLAAAPEFESRVKALIAGGENRIILDCRDLKYVSSSGIGAFISCGKQLTNSGALVFAGLTHHVQSVFEMTGLTRIFTICQTKEDALRRLESDGNS
jgi:anti-anti-sigma factor